MKNDINSQRLVKYLIENGKFRSYKDIEKTSRMIDTIKRWQGMGLLIREKEEDGKFYYKFPPFIQKIVEANMNILDAKQKEDLKKDKTFSKKKIPNSFINYLADIMRKN